MSSKVELSDSEFETTEINKLQQKIIKLQQEIKKYKEGHQWLQSQNATLKKQLKFEYGLRFNVPIKPPLPTEINPTRPITIIMNNIFIMHLVRSRQGIEEWQKQEWNYSANYSNEEFKKAWLEYAWMCLLLQIPVDEQMKMELNEDDCTLKIIVPSNVASQAYSFPEQPPEAVCFPPITTTPQPPSGKKYTKIFPKFNK